MSQVEKNRGKSTGRNPLRYRNSVVMKKSSPGTHSRRCKEEWQQADTERDKVDMGHLAASSGGGQQIHQSADVLCESLIQPGNVRRLVEKFRRLGESTFNSKPCNRNVPFAILRKKSDRLKKSQMTEEKWILLTPSLFSSHELDSCSLGLSPPTIPVIRHQKPSDGLSPPTVIRRQKLNRSAVQSKHRDCGLQDIVLGCEHEVTEIVLPIESITIDNPAELQRRLTIGVSKEYVPNDKADNEQICVSKEYLPNDKAENEQIYEEIELVETPNCLDEKNVVLCDETKENSEDVSQQDLVLVNNISYEEIDIKPLNEFCQVPSLVIMRKERLYEEIDADSISSHSEYLNLSDAGNRAGNDSRTADHPSNSVQNFMSDDSIYEEIDLSSPMIVVRDQSFSPSSCFSTLNALDNSKSEIPAVTQSQREDSGSASSVFEESSSTDSVISDLDDYDIIYKSEILEFDFSQTKTDMSSCDLKNVHHKRSVPCISIPSGGEICKKSRNKSCPCQGVSSKTAETSECKKNACGSNDEENIYENYHFTPAIVSCQGSANNCTKRKSVAFTNISAEYGPNSETGYHEHGLTTDTISEGSSSRNSCCSSSYESFSSDDEYENASADRCVPKHGSEEEPPSDSGTEEPVTKLHRIIREIVDTERKYIKRLKLINDEFRVAVTAWNQEKNYIPADIVRQMFLNIDIIYKLHSGFFLPELEACINKDMGRKIEDVFIKGADFLKLYAEYSCNFSTAMKLIEQWKSKVPEFSRFILGIQQKPVCQSLTLEHHMLEPILRIPRYELLLNKYLDHLPEDSPEREKSLKAVHKVTAAASHCNDFIISMEKYRKVMDVQQSLWGKFDLMTPSRELIMEGRMKVTQQQCKDEDKHLFLFNDTLLVCKIFPLGITPPYKVILQMDIDDMKVMDRHKDEIVETFFVISKQGYLEMHPGSKEEKEKWISALNAVINKYMALMKSRLNSTSSRSPSYTRQKSITGTHAPIWIKDPQANRCMQCDEKFTAIKRRHHCRACGIVVCGKCSSKEAVLAFDNSSQLHRVCDKCFLEISSSAKDDNESETKVSHTLERSVLRLSRTNAGDSERRSIFFYDNDLSSQLKYKEEQTATELTKRLDAIIEVDTESKDSQEHVT